MSFSWRLQDRPDAALAQRTHRRRQPHGTGKSAPNTFARFVAYEAGPLGINVNVVAPGFVRTERSAQIPEQLKRRLVEHTPWGGSLNRSTWPSRSRCSSVREPASSPAQSSTSTVATAWHDRRGERFNSLCEHTRRGRKNGPLETSAHLRREALGDRTPTVCTVRRSIGSLDDNPEVVCLVVCGAVGRRQEWGMLPSRGTAPMISVPGLLVT